jgi:hypothetical protein
LEQSFHSSTRAYTVHLQKETAKCLVVGDEGSTPNSRATLGFWVGSIVESGRFGKELGCYKRSSPRLMPIKKHFRLIEMELRNSSGRSMSLPQEVTVRFHLQNKFA